MPILKNKVQKNFTIVDNRMFHDKKLSMRDRGLLSTICSYPDGWNFSIAGVAANAKDGKDSIRASLKVLEKGGYLKRTMKRDPGGRFVSEIEVMPESTAVADSPTRSNRRESAVTDKPTELNKKNKELTSSTDYPSIHREKTDGETDADAYRALVADNIKLGWLLDTAEQHGDKEVEMVHEIYDLICDMVCYTRGKVEIKGTSYPWETVKSQFLKLRYQHVADILNRIVDADLHIRNMEAYLISTLYTASLTGTLEAQASLHDDYLKSLRGNPYT